MRISSLAVFAFLVIPAPRVLAADEPVPLADGVRGLITQTNKKVALDGKLDEWPHAFCTPVHYNHRDLENRAAQFLYMWDEEALYIGLRALDKKMANPGTNGAVFNGDAVEFYLDTRPGENLRAKDWTKGAVHLFYSPFEGKEKKPRWVMRAGI